MGSVSAIAMVSGGSPCAGRHSPSTGPQGFANLAVPAEPLLRGEVSIQRVAEKHMGKTVLSCGGEEGCNDLSRNCIIERLHELHRRRTRHTCERLHIKGVPHYTGKLQEGVGRGRQGAHTPSNCFAHTLGQRQTALCLGRIEGGGAIFRHEQSHHLCQEERIAFRALVQRRRGLPPASPPS